MNIKHYKADINPDFDMIKSRIDIIWNNTVLETNTFRKDDYVKLRVEKVSLISFFMRRKTLYLTPDDCIKKILKNESEYCLKNDEFLTIKIYEGEKYRERIFYDYLKREMTTPEKIIKEGRAILNQDIRDNGHNYIYSLKKHKKGKNRLCLNGFFVYNSNNEIKSFMTNYCNSRIIDVKYLFSENYKSENGYVFPIFLCEHGEILGNKLFFKDVTRYIYYREKIRKKIGNMYEVYTLGTSKSEENNNHS